MKVSKLIELLKKCHPDAIVEVDAHNERGEVTTTRQTFYNNKENKFVILNSTLSNQSTDLEEKQKEKLDSVKMTVERVLKVF